MMKEMLQEMVNGYGFGISVEGLASEVYHQLRAQGSEPCIVNDRYIEVDGVTYQFRKTRAKGHWTVACF